MDRKLLLGLSVLLAIVASTACVSNPVNSTTPASSVPPDPVATTAPPAPAVALFTSPAPAATPEEAASATPEPPVPTSATHGLRVAYFGAGKIMLWTEGAGARRLAVANNVEQIRISDDGQEVAYLGRNAQGGYDLWGVNAGGSNPYLLVGADYLQTLQAPDKTIDFAFAPASHAVYFVTDQYDLHRVNAGFGSPATILEAGKGGYFSFSPDGRWMTLYRPNELVLARPDGTEAHVAFQFPEDYRWTGGGPEIRWKPDGSGFYVVSPTSPQGSAGNMAVWFVPVAGQPAKQMSYTGPYDARLSPDGRTVVHLNERSQPLEVHVVTGDGNDALFGKYANVHFMGWAPDSKHFLLDLSTDLRLQLPYLCAVGEKPVKLADVDDAEHVVWVDAQRVLYSSHALALRLQHVGIPSIVLDAEASFFFDYTSATP